MFQHLCILLEIGSENNSKITTIFPCFPLSSTERVESTEGTALAPREKDGESTCCIPATDANLSKRIAIS